MKVLHRSKKSICATSRDIASKGEFISENREAYGNNLIVAWIYGSPAWTVAMIIAWFFGGALKAILNGPGSVEATVILLISGIAMFGDLFGLIIAIDALRHEDRVVATWHLVPECFCCDMHNYILDVDICLTFVFHWLYNRAFQRCSKRNGIDKFNSICNILLGILHRFRNAGLRSFAIQSKKYKRYQLVGALLGNGDNRNHWTHSARVEIQRVLAPFFFISTTLSFLPKMSNKGQ